jgi:magnesium chelatase family protein
MDRIDIHIEVPAVSDEVLRGQQQGESSALIRSRVERARERQRARFAGRPGICANAHMRPRELREFCRIDDRSAALLKAAMSRLGLSARAYHRVLKIARTIADLEGVDDIRTAHVAEAIQYRSLDRAGRG